MTIPCSVNDRVSDTETVRETMKAFVDLRIKDPAKAYKKYPTLTYFMDTEFKSNFPKEAAEMEAASKEYENWHKNADALELQKARTYFTPHETWGDWMSKKWKGVVGEGSLVHKFVDDLTEIAKIGPDAYVQARLYRGAAESALEYVKHGRFEYSEGGRRDKVIGKGLDAIIEPILDHYEDASAYLSARTINEDLVNADKKYSNIKSKATKSKAEEAYLKKQEVNGVYTPKTSTDMYRQTKEAVAIAEKKYSHMKQFGQEFSEFMRDNLKYALDAKLISQESYDAMVGSRDMYAPIFRVVEGSNKHGLGFAKGMEPEKVTRARTHVESAYDIYDPIQTAYNNAAMTIAVAERNGVMRTLVREGLQEAKKGNIVFEEVIGNEKSKEQLLDAIEKKGLPVEYFENLPKEVIEMLMENPIVSDSPTLNVFEDGVKKTYQVDPVIYEAVKGIGSQSEMGLLGKMLSFPAQTLRVGATMTPSFIARSFLRDIPHALTTTQFGITPIDIAKGVFSAFKKDAWYSEFVRSGGAYSNSHSLTRSGWQENIGKLEKAKKSGFLKRWVVDNKLGFEKMKQWGHALENAPRIAEFRKGIESGASREKAALAAREITLDHQRKGTVMYAYNQIVPFSNAFIQGQSQFVKQLYITNSQGKATFEDTVKPYLRMAAYIGVPTVAMAMINAGNKRVRDQPQSQQDMFYHFDIDGTIIRVPKVQEFGTILMNQVESAIYAFHDQDPKAFYEQFQNTIGSIVTSRLLVPTAIVPAIEAFANKSIFYQSPIVPRSRENLLPSEQYSEKNTELFKDLTKGLAKIFGDKISPAIAENFVDKWGGSMGRDMLNAVDIGWKAFKGDERILDDLRPDSTYFVKSFVASYPNMSVKPIRDFFEKYKSADDMNKTIRKLVSEGRGKEASELNTKWNKVRNTTSYKAITRIMSFIKKIKGLDMDPRRKSELKDQALLQMMHIAEQANKTFDLKVAQA